MTTSASHNANIVPRTSHNERKPEKLGSEPGRAIAGGEPRGYAETTLPGPKPERAPDGIRTAEGARRAADAGGIFPALPPSFARVTRKLLHASKMVRESAHVSTICVTPPRHRAVDPGVRFRQTGRRGSRRGPGRRRLDPPRRDGRPFRPQQFPPGRWP